MEALTKLKSHKSKYPWDAVWINFLAGATHEELADMFSIPMITVVQYSAAHYWSQRRAQALAIAREATTNDLKTRIEKRRNRHQSFMLEKLEHIEGHIAQLEIGEDKDAGEVPIERIQTILDKHDITARRVLGMDKEENENPMKAGFLLLAALGQANLVNESHQILEMEAEFEPKSLPSLINLGGEEQPKQPVPLCDPSDDTKDPLAGILRSGNGIPNEVQTPDLTILTDIPPITGEPGPQPTSEPVKGDQPFTPPKPLVNENPPNE